MIRRSKKYLSPGRHDALTDHPRTADFPRPAASATGGTAGKNPLG
ncbi:hypothetical protein EHW99_0255 [Erwinia amylovora]|nr:hypothetical protein EHX00_0255 [Erwinia amylovora]QJQ56660.1 hypothetical protein EHW99_0255 [Erwinia amylovora]QJQ60359.1 hypothetical protein EHW98_0255 [Erwinia amylovora]QJQ64161.1 hypothetical protein EHW96_0255 [Erwinia amylovora]QJQ67860.1 hypothetical protein EGZ89_0255 [Erwinia amylovora]